jgi:drug/metabolite transporter, DME family
MTKLTAYLLVSSALVLWGLAGVFTKTMLDAGLGGVEIAFWRLLLSGVLFCGQSLLQRDFKLKATKDLWHLAGFAVFIIALNYLSFNYAIAFGGISLVNVLLATVPAFIALPAWLFLRERVTPRLLSLLVFSIVGLMLASWGGGKGIHISFASLSFSIVAVLTAAAFTLASKPLLSRYTPVTLNAFVMPLAALALLPFVSFTGVSFTGVSFTDKLPQVWPQLTLLVLLPSYLAYLLFQTGLEHLTVSQSALLTNLDPATGLVLAALFFGERFNTLGLVGVVLVLATSVLATLPEKFKRPALQHSYEAPLQVMALEISRAEAET